MAKVKIVSDSTCDLPWDFIEKYNIDIVPTNIIFESGEVRKQYVDITNKELYQRLLDGEMPTTGIPSPKDFKKVYDKALEESNEVIVFCVSSKLSGMYSNASMVAKQFFDERVTVIDTLLVTLQMGLVVLEVARKAETGASKKELLDYVQHLLPTVQAICAVPTLKYLRKGGRIGKIASLVGDLLNIKPIISVEDGELIPLRKIRKIKNAHKILRKFAHKIAGRQTVETAFVIHTANHEKAEGLAKHFRAIPNAPREVLVIEVGPAIGVHLGPGALGFVWIGEFNKEWL